jgi:hypothetical protein
VHNSAGVCHWTEFPTNEPKRYNLAEVQSYSQRPKTSAECAGGLTFNMATLMVVFGAGASYDSIPAYGPSGAHVAEIEDKRPPLADQLFDNRPEFASALARFEACLPIVPYLRHRPQNTTVEQVLERFQAEASDDPQRFRQLAAVRYYLHFLLWQSETTWIGLSRGVTNYRTLLDEIRHYRKPDDQVCLVTFNYDRLLEDALRFFRVNIQEIGDYIANDKYKVIKLHGSVDWAREVDTTIENVMGRNTWEIAYDLIERAPELEITNRYRMVTECPIGKSSEDNKALFPALAIPLEKKLDSECPDEHLRVLQQCVRETTKLLLIGWRATEEHFLRLLRENLSPGVRGVVVAKDENEATRTAESIAHAGIRGEFIAAKGGFSDFIVRREGETLLKS